MFAWLALGAEVVASVAYGEGVFPKVRAPGAEESNWHEQWVFLVLALMMNIFFTFATAVFVRLEANNWRLSKVAGLALATELVAGGSAAISWVLMGSMVPHGPHGSPSFPKHPES